MTRPQDAAGAPPATAAPGLSSITGDHGRSPRGYGSFPISDRANNSDDVLRTTTTTTTAAVKKKQSPRALAPDLLRGLLMLVMALDHTALALNTWQHGTGRDTEMDGMIIGNWNRPVAYVVRTLTHLCAPGFTFLLGVGSVYLGRSRSRLGWSSMRIARYFAVRGLVLTLVNTVLGLLVSGGQVWFMNFVLFSLAVDYFLVGMLWLVVNTTEPLLAKGISRMLEGKAENHDDDDDKDVEEEPLLRPREAEADFGASATRASTWSWHIHNAILFVLSIVTIWWNIWLSPVQGHCQPQSEALQPMTLPQPPEPQSPAVSKNPLDLWFWIVMSPRVVSVFPPMAWFSFAILGLLCARLDLARPWSHRAIALGYTCAGLACTILFVLTRVLRFGNLSEDCLQTPEHIAHPDQNPYLVSVQSFFYIIKYPPDVAFWAMTMAGNFFLLAIFNGVPAHITQRFTILLDFGRAALYFYVIHLFLVFFGGNVLVRLFGHESDIPSQNDPSSTLAIDNAWAYFAIWAMFMLALWPMVRRYGRFKATKPADSLWRLF
ncbi:hypothetical protein BGZ63DRAFT_87958 [Mariannaea sp. PMI_226]|nr:hypothetical protein BGZ63DRAFT_87958 [Mariannaea sp. PMI_226]